MGGVEVLMPVRDELGKRMKIYEGVPKRSLMRRTPVAIRIDGKAFHTFTRGFVKPFDRVLMNAMQRTMKFLCENIQNCVFGYTQSDEITLILVDYRTLDTAAWFDNKVSKIESVSASMATLAFNRYFLEEVREFLEQNQDEESYQQYLTYSRALEKGALFDSRCFNIPKEEVTNLIYWRQLDATRNSIQMVGQSQFSHRQLEGKSCNDIQNMLLTRRDINWNDFPIDCKRGAACYRRVWQESVMGNIETFMDWYVDKEMPILKGEDRGYVDQLIYLGED